MRSELMKDGSKLPVEWINEFEGILRKLYWYEAIAVSEFTGIRYEWSVEPGTIHDPAKPGNLKVRCTVGKKEELPYDVAIDGDYPIDASSKKPGTKDQ
jgi:hypothetical protein